MPAGPAIAMKHKIVLAKKRKDERAASGEAQDQQFKAGVPGNGAVPAASKSR